MKVNIKEERQKDVNLVQVVDLAHLNQEVKAIKKREKVKQNLGLNPQKIKNKGVNLLKRNNNKVKKAVRSEKIHKKKLQRKNLNNKIHNNKTPRQS